MAKADRPLDNINGNPGKSSQSDVSEHGLTTWVQDNALNPAYNALIVEPGNALRQTVNCVARPVISKDLIEPRLNSAHSTEAKFLGGEWWTQNICSGLAAAAVYSVAGKFAGGALGLANSKVKILSSHLLTNEVALNTGRVTDAVGGAGNFVGRVMLNEKVAQVIGAACYDGMKETKPGETNLGNMAGGAASFSVFEMSNTFIDSKFRAAGSLGLLGKARREFGKAGLRIIPGALGSSAQIVSSHLLSKQEMPSDQKAWVESMVAGGAMNAVLPWFQRGMNRRRPVQDLESSVKKDDSSKEKLGAPVVDTITSLVCKTDPTRQYSDYTHYFSENVSFVRSSVNIYTVNGHTTKIIYPKSDGFSLLSLTESETQIPEKIAGLLDELPDARLVKNIRIDENPHYNEPWLKLSGERNCKIEAEATRDGDIIINQPKAHTNLRNVVFHEFAHLLKNRDSIYGRLFNDAVILEPKKHIWEKEVACDPDETYAVLMGEELLVKGFDDVIPTMKKYPLESAICMRDLEQCLRTIPAELRSTEHRKYESRISYANRVTVPKAKKILVEKFSDPDLDIRKRAVRVFGSLGSIRDMEILYKELLSSKDKDLSKEITYAILRIFNDSGISLLRKR